MCIKMLGIPREFVEHPMRTLLGITGIPTISWEICVSPNAHFSV